ncbi:MAG: hypothetical protein CL793_04100, partial [Chloroflexi bacterium]|nr:hypothetical protein [Chloroflexota bacterium]
MKQLASKTRYLLTVLGIGLLTSGVLACSSDPETVEVIKEVEVEKIVEVAADPGNLVIYSGRKESLVGPIIEQFSESNGINVEVKY